MPRRQLFYRSILSLIATIFLSAAAHADAIDITLTPVSQSGMAGTTITFEATLTNLAGSTIFLNGDSVTTSSSFLVLDDNPFLTHAPLSLAPGAVSGPFALFSVFITPGTPNGVYNSNTFTILGGTSSGDFNNVGSAQFDVAVAPEPGTIVLLTSGLLGLGIKLRSRLR